MIMELIDSDISSAAAVHDYIGALLGDPVKIRLDTRSNNNCTITGTLLKGIQ